jgi:hypothetical protein
MFQLCPPLYVYTIPSLFHLYQKLTTYFSKIHFNVNPTMSPVSLLACCLLAFNFRPWRWRGFIPVQSRYSTRLHDGPSQKLSQITPRVPQIQVDVFQCFSTKIVYEFRVFLILLTFSAYEDSKISLPWQNPYVNAKRNGVRPVLCFSFALQKVLGWNIFSVYYDNSLLLRIMYTSVSQTVFWRQNHGGIITIVPWIWYAENAICSV